jgi:hypothetical protein
VQALSVFNTQSNSGTLYDSSYLNNYMFAARTYLNSAASIGWAPLRFLFQTNVGTTFPSTTKLTFTVADIQSPPCCAGGTGAWNLQAGRSLSCYVKEYSSGTVTGFKFFSTNCAFVNPANTQQGFTISTPSLHSFIDGLTYEIIVTANEANINIGGLYGIGFGDPQQVSDASLLVYDSTTSTKYHFQVMHSYLYAYQRVAATTFYATQLSQGAGTEMYLKFKVLDGITSGYGFPTSYVELQFSGLKITDVLTP